MRAPRVYCAFVCVHECMRICTRVDDDERGGATIDEVEHLVLQRMEVEVGGPLHADHAV